MNANRADPLSPLTVPGSEDYGRAATDNVGVTGYQVYSDGALVASPTSTSVAITGLSASTLYAFTVAAFDAAGNASAQAAPLPVTTRGP